MGATGATGAAVNDVVDSASRPRRMTGSQEKEAMEKLYRGLQEARNRVDQVFHEDSKSTDLYDQLSTQSEPQNYFFEPYASQWCPQMVKKGAMIPLPAVIAATLDDVKSLALSGLLQPIDHAWASIDTKLFLWNYKKRGQFTVFEFDQAIVAVGLCLTPRAGIFTDKVHHLLVVATTVEVILLAVLYEDNDRQTGRIKLQRTKLSVSTDNCVVRRILASAAGRVFFAGSDGGLYEMVYTGPADQSNALMSLFAKPCRKVSHTTNYANYLPSFLVGLAGAPGKVIQVALDDDRQTLYVLFENGDISVYDLGVRGDETKLVCTGNLLAQGAKYARENRRTRVSCPDERIFQSSNMTIVSLAVVPRTESAFVSLVAVSSNGIRFYLTVYARSAYTVGNTIPRTKRPSRLDLVFVRLPPPAIAMSDAPPYHAKEGMQPGYAPGKSPASVHAAFHRKGVFILVDGGKDEHDRLIGIAHDPISTALPTQATRKTTLRESIALDTCGGKVTDIDELADNSKGGMATRRGEGVSTHPASSLTNGARANGTTNALKRSFDEMSNGLGGINENVPIVNEMALQYSEPARHFLCLTNAGIQVMKKIRPIDQLHRALLLSRGSELRTTLAPFVRGFGEVQVCCMLLAIACGVSTDPVLGDTAAIAQRNGVKNDDFVYSSALQGIFECGQLPSSSAAATSCISTGPTDAARASSGPASTRIVMTTEFEMSCQHDGLVMFVGRVLRPLLSARTLGKRVLVRVQGTGNSGSSSITRNQSQSKGSAPPSGLLRTFQLVHSSEKLDEIREILFQLRQLMEHAGPYAVSITSGSVLEKTDELNENSATAGPSRVIELTHRYQKARSDEQLQREQRFKQEQRSLYFLYQLVLRSIEGISLLRMIQEYDVELEESLARLSFAEFVASVEGSSAVKLMIKAMMKGRNENNQFLIKQLREQCPSFFSVADLWHYQGYKSLALAKMSAPTGRRSYLKESLSQFLQSCHMWDTDDCINVLHAICEDYISMNYYEGVVKLSLACAKNFGDAAATDLSGVKLKLKRSCMGCILLALQRLLERSEDCSSKSKSGGSPQAVEDMVSLDEESRTKYMNEVFQHALASEDSDFHELLYAWLYENGHSHLLTSIRSSFIEAFLKDKDQDLLIKLYMDQHKYLVAAKVWWNRAYEDNGDLENNPDVMKRQYFVSKALGCLKSMEDSPEAVDGIREVRDVLDVLQLQIRVMKSLEQDTNALEETGEFALEDVLERREDVNRLKFKIFDASTLYNEFASKYDMWAECLHIIHACHSQESDVIEMLWNRIVFSAIPPSSNHTEFNAWRATQCERIGLSVQWPSGSTFENGLWIGQLQCKVLRLGKTLFYDTDDRQPGAALGSFVFPVSLLAKQLEQLSMWYLRVTNTHIPAPTSTFDPSSLNWVLKVFLDVGVPHRVLLGSYELNYREQNSVQWSIHLLQSMYAIVTLWKKTALSPRCSNDQLTEFAGSCPQLVDTCDDFITDLKTMSAENHPQVALLLEQYRRMRSELINFRNLV